MEYETVGAAVDGSAVGQPKYKVKAKRKPLEVFMNALFFLCGMVAVAFVLIISIYLVISGLPAILEIGPINFLFGTRWYASTGDFGIFAIILTSIAGTAGAILIGVPIGLMTAIFLAKVANPKLAKVVHTAVELLAGIPSVVYGLVGMILLVPAIRVAIILTSIAGTAGAILIGVPIGLMTAIFLAKVANPKLAKVVHTAVELLAGIPSVVYGLVGMILLVPAIRVAFGLPSGATLLAAIIVLSIMILPSIISVSETALRAVPREYEEASLALGATHIETVFRVTVPAARSGIATAIVLGIGRAIGEAMAIIMVAGNVANMPGLLTPVRFLTTAIASEMSYASVGSLHRNALFSIGLVLFLFIMMINVFLNVFIKNKKEG